MWRRLFRCWKMAPVAPKQMEININNLIQSNKVMIFSKSYCPFCVKVKNLFTSFPVEYNALELDKIDDGPELQKVLSGMTGKSTVPQVFVNKVFIGGCDDTFQAHSEGRLKQLLQIQTEQENYDFDLVIVGGGSGGISAAKTASALGKRVAVLDFVKPSPIGTSWGLGGTCVNVGCIPKKLMHQAAILGQSIKDARHYGWEVPDVKHNWEAMKNAIQDHIHSLNWKYRVALRENGAKYINGYGQFVSPHKLQVTDKRGKETFITTDKVIIATGERPRYPDCPGAKEYGITSDDLFSLSYCPGRTLVIGASYVALECAGFLHGIGLDVTVMVRSILLRGFDQEMANRIGDYMEKEGIKFIRKCIPEKIECLENGQPGRLKVTGKMVETSEEVVDEYNTVIFAIGRNACTTDIGLENVGVNINPKNFKIPAINEQTNIPNIYAIGDVLEGKPELTPVAIEAGMLLAKRMFSGSNIQCDYINVPTTVFTPLEYGCVGYSEEAAIEKFGRDNIEVYHTLYTPLEWEIAHREQVACYAKIICLRNENEKIVGFHYLGPNAGEVTQGFAVAIKKGTTKEELDATIGIHPTCAELFTTLKTTKSSGAELSMKGC
ncbi:thioredoxin reductase 1, cytoplasmic-like [Centruroides vittatus]|uniref:thioredoxin reductase 1, cytoplasmic-like n=1 Tax=Centruroides vittatus TaxID=120091 RepID=UPI00350F6D67